MRLLITRPEPDAIIMAQSLKALDIQCILSPILTVIPCNIKKTISRQTALLLTSKQAIFYLKTIAFKDRLILTVGSQTQESVRKLGFTQVLCAHGTSQDLLDFVCLEIPKSQPLMYLSGQDVSLDLSEVLQEQGYICDRLVVYKTKHKPLSLLAIQALQRGEIDGIIFMSLKTVEAFVHALKVAMINPNCLRTVIAFALSSSIASALTQFTWGNLLTADHPTGEDFEALLNRSKEFFHGRKQRYAP